MLVPTMQAWSRWATHKNPFLNNGFALGFQLSWFHATSPCQAKRDNKWRIEYFTYLKRKKRAESKRDLRGWRFVEFSSADVRRMHEPFTSHLDPKVQKKGKACNRAPDQGAKMDFRGRSARKRHTRQENQNSTHVRGNTHESRCHHSHTQRNWNCQFQNFWEFEFRRDSSWEEFDIFSEEEEEGYEKESGYSRSGEDYESMGKRGHRILGYKRSIGKASDRAALGLAPSGPLTLEELKKAFRESAMKWHPDRHQGPAKVAAEAKFKHCGAAYKSLTDALSSA